MCMLSEINELKSLGFKAKNYEQQLLETIVELESMYEEAPIIMILMNANRDIIRYNKPLMKMLNVDKKELLGLRGGEVFNCVHHIDIPEGCGFGLACETCDLKNLVENTIKTGTTHRSKETDIECFNNKGERYKLNIKFTSIQKVRNGKKFVLLYIEDVYESNPTC